MGLEKARSYLKKGAVCVAAIAGAFLLYKAVPDKPTANTSKPKEAAASTAEGGSSSPDPEAYAEKMRALLSGALRPLNRPVVRELHQLSGQHPDGHIEIGDGVSDQSDWKAARLAETARLKCYRELQRPDYDPGPCLAESREAQPEIWEALRLQESLKLEKLLSVMENGKNPGEIQLEDLIHRLRVVWGLDPDQPQAIVQEQRQDFLAQLEMIGRTEDGIREIIIQTASKCATLGAGSCTSWVYQFNSLGMTQDPETGEWSW